MGELFVLKSKFVVPAGSKVLKAKEYAVLVEAREVIAQAMQRAEDIKYDAQQACEDQKHQGYLDGLEQGRQEIAQQMIEQTQKAMEYIDSLEKTVVEVVMQSLRKILGDMDNKELVTAVVSQSLRHLRGQKRVVIRVSPADEDAVHELLESMQKDGLLDVAFFTVEADSRLQKGGCMLETETGSLDASVETQLKAIENAFHKRLG